MKPLTYRHTRIACYGAYVTQAIINNLAPLLFTIFQRRFGVTLEEVGSLILINFTAQIFVDLAAARFADKIGYRTCVVFSQILSAVGLVLMAILPDMLPVPFIGILISVVLYAIGSGLVEVLVSPIVEACPFENKDGVMSLLHSFYCWGAVGVILGSTLFFSLFGTGTWRILAGIWALIPLYNIYNFATCPIEPIVADGKSMTISELFKTKIFWAFILLMICAGASEASIAQWASAFAESALHVSKTVGDLAGPCGFAVFMGISRTLYGKAGGRIDLTAFMMLSAALCLVCYLVAGLANIPMLGLVGCMLCGFAVGIMWPGSISISSSILPSGGTAMFALLALAGDMGASMGPALVGTVSQIAGDNLQAGILAGAGFPAVLALCVLLVRKWRRGKRPQQA